MTGQYEGGGNFGELTEIVEEPRVKRVYLFGEGSEMRIKKENVVNKAKYTFFLHKIFRVTLGEASSAIRG